MKTRPTTRGVALVIVLSFLVLISAITLGFFSSVSTELAASKAVSNSAQTKQLADSAVNVVMSQLVDATKAKSGDKAVAWVSQPGMIRTFDSAGAPKDFFKLYSSDAMTVDGANFKVADEIPPNEWNSTNNSELYTDLNAPSANASGELVYPIVDPAADGSASPGRPADGFKVEGFSLSANPGFDTSKTESGVNNRAPMPVKWIYVLKDGTLKSASSPSATGVTVTGASAANPIVGRISFWADDETGKVNINTASEGVYWDVPRIFSNEDFGSGGNLGFSLSQPVQKEFQRYPGHPATTSLSPVFGSLLTVPPVYPVNPKATDSTKLDPYYNLTPRVGLANGGGGGGSKSGSLPGASTGSVLTPDTDRLYASVDELMFTPKLAGTSRIPNTSTSAAPKTINKGILEKAGFFITANSTAPETTLYNTPRVAVWPVSTAVNQRTAYDSLLAFCSTIGGKEYFFTRTPTTGSRSSIADFTPNSRNEILYKYLRTLTSTDVPGFGDNFLKKFSVNGSDIGERDQILTYIFDYIRCTNLQDQSTGAVAYTGTYPSGKLGAGEVVPIRINSGAFTTQGFGRFLSVSSANVLFYGARATAGKMDRMRAMFFFQFATPMQGLACMRANVKYTVTGLDGLQVKVGAGDYASLNFRPGGTNYLDRRDLDIYHGRDVGGTEGPVQALLTDGGGTKPFLDGDAGGTAHNKYPFFSFQDLAIPGGQTTFSFKSTKEIIVEIRAADKPDTDPAIQKIHLNFPETTALKLPSVVDGGMTHLFGSRNLVENPNHQHFVQKAYDTVVSLQVGGADLAANAGTPGPGVDLTAGDSRMTASLAEVSANRFRPHNDYMNKGVQFAHGLLMSVGVALEGAKFGKLVNVPGNTTSNPTDPNDPSRPYFQANSILRQPDVPSRVTTGVTRLNGGPGDWDTGFGDQKDGAYINKPDEGDTAFQDNAGGAQRLPYMLGFGQGFAAATNVFFSPNRQMPSPLMFGSIPTGVQRMLPWQTLLFHPRREDSNHPGNLNPKDHLLADLFWMPVVEPYAISQPFATAGKINLNYQIMPFSYMNRSTGLQAVMKSTKFAALELADAAKYKPLDKSGTSPTAPNRRRTIDMNKTLEGFDDKFKDIDNRKNIFKSASQICEMDLVPANLAGNTSANGYKSMATFWNSCPLTGDNLREKPYVDLYSRLTTKSNTYTVHVRVQALKKAPGTPVGQWLTGRDKVVGEYRGSSILERYIDLNDPDLALAANDFAKNPTSVNIDQYYKMRVISTKRFNP